jgi:hypothetical protein
MEADRFDLLIKSLSAAGSRRGLLRLIAALPLAGALAALVSEESEAGRRRRRKARHDPGKDKDNRKGKRKKKGKGKRRKKGNGQTPQSGPTGQPSCVPESAAQTCAGQCGSVANTCGTLIDCGPCDCGLCPACHTCDTATGRCIPNTAVVDEVCGDGQVCQADGTCACRGGSCGGCRTCQRDGACSAYCVSGGCCGAGETCGACLVFVTSTHHDGNLGGLSGADEICQQRAQAAGLPGAAIAGTYKAWLSTSNNQGDNPLTRFRHSTLGYQRVDGVKVADSWDDLVDGTIDNPIDVSETGAKVGHFHVWTNTATSGVAADPFVDDCNNWTSGSWDDEGRIGEIGSTDATWTTVTVMGGRVGIALPCSSGQLYCFQQE